MGAITDNQAFRGAFSDGLVLSNKEVSLRMFQG